MNKIQAGRGSLETRQQRKRETSKIILFYEPLINIPQKYNRPICRRHLCSFSIEEIWSSKLQEMASSRVLNLTRAHRLALLSSRRWLSSSALVEVNPGEVGMISGIPEQHLRRRVSLCFVYYFALLVYLDYLFFIDICISDLVICWLWRIYKESNRIHVEEKKNYSMNRIHESLLLGTCNWKKGRRL
jgi:hypothetical protein